MKNNLIKNIIQKAGFEIGDLFKYDEVTYIVEQEDIDKKALKIDCNDEICKTSNIIKTKVYKDSLKAGMTIEIDNELHTIGKKELRRCVYLGVLFRNRSYQKTYTRIQYVVPTNNGLSVR